jgi:hypothetical protein
MRWSDCHALISSVVRNNEKRMVCRFCGSGGVAVLNEPPHGFVLSCHCGRRLDIDPVRLGDFKEGSDAQFAVIARSIDAWGKKRLHA